MTGLPNALRQYCFNCSLVAGFAMSNYPFHRANKKGITKIGTAGSWVKPSSGYAFKNIEKSAQKVIQNIKEINCNRILRYCFFYFVFSSSMH